MQRIHMWLRFMCFVVRDSSYVTIATQFWFCSFPQNLIWGWVWNSRSFKCQASILHWAEIYIIFKTKTYQLVFKRAFGAIVLIRHLLNMLPWFPVTMTSGCYHYYLFDIILDPSYACIFLWWHGAFLLFVGRMWKQNQNQYVSWKAKRQRKEIDLYV